MRILFTNDDGIDAPGINILAEAFLKDNEVYMVAPKANCSAYSHSLTIYKDLFYETYASKSGITAFSVSGTPADCVKFALINLLSQSPPDIVISGINNGPNLGSDIMYSGTVAAAFEAAYLGIPAIAVSLNYWNKEDSFYLEAAEFLKRNLDAILKLHITPGTIININYPAAQEFKGAVITRTGINLYSDLFVESEKSGGYKLKGEPVAHNKNDDDCDVEWSKKGYATITPLKLDRTDYRVLELIKNKADIK